MTPDLVRIEDWFVLFTEGIGFLVEFVFVILLIAFGGGWLYNRIVYGNDDKLFRRDVKYPAKVQHRDVCIVHGPNCHERNEVPSDGQESEMETGPARSNV